MKFDPRDPAFRASPYATYRDLRSRDPIHYRPDHGDWILTRYADISAVLGDRRFGRSEGWTSGALPSTDGVELNPLVRYRKQSEALLRLWILLSNPPDHG